MWRSSLPFILIVLSLLVATFVGALVNIVTGRIPPDAPYLSYALPALGLALLASIGLAIWQYRLDHRGDSEQQTPAATSQVNVVVNVGEQHSGSITGAVINLPRDARAKRNRQAMLAKVKSIWITGFLEQQSLAKELRITLDLAEHPDAVTLPLNALVQELRRPPRPLPAGTPISEVFDTMGGALLILGAPGAGKTTLLLELARDLIARAEQNDELPIPVVFNLASWAEKRLPLHLWLTEELQARYDVPRRLVQAWMGAEAVLPLLDGLDEVAAEQRDKCVEAINIYRHGHGLVPLAVCSRVADYDALTSRLQLQGAVVVQPLTSQQIDAYLMHIGDSLTVVRTLLKDDPVLWELMETPLILNIVLLTYKDQPVTVLESGISLDERRVQLFNAYIKKMFQRRGETLYTQKQTKRWLSWLAAQMTQHDLIVFSSKYLQPIWLPQELRKKYFNYHVLVQLPMIGLAFGGFVGLLAKLIFGRWDIALLVGLLLGLVAGLGDLFVPDSQKRSLLQIRTRNISLVIGSLVDTLTALIMGMFMGVVAWFALDRTNDEIGRILIALGFWFGLLGALGDNTSLSCRTKLSCAPPPSLAQGYSTLELHPLSQFLRRAHLATVGRQRLHLRSPPAHGTLRSAGPARISR